MVAGNKKLDEKWLYCASITNNSKVKGKYSQSYQKISDIVKKEKCKGVTPFIDEKAIYLEVIEGMLAKGKRSKLPIVDFTFGIIHNNFSKYRLIEAKFDVKDLKNIDKKNILDKVSHSRDVMSEDGVQIEGGAVILINKSDIVQQQMDWFSRQLMPFGNYQIMTIDDLYNRYFIA